MRRRIRSFTLLTSITILVSSAGVAESNPWLGGGIHYLRNLGDITSDGDIDLNQNSVSILGSYKYDLGLIGVDGQVEYIFNYVGTDKAMWQPSVWGVVGNFFYGGAGIGIGYTDGDWQNNPFYALRAGVELHLDKLALDVYASYRFQSDADLKNLTGEDLDSLTFAAIARFGLN